MEDTYTVKLWTDALERGEKKHPLDRLLKIEPLKKWPPERKKILYIDMDGVVADLEVVIQKYCPGIGDMYDPSREGSFKKMLQDNRRIFLELPLLDGAVEAIEALKPYFEIYFLSTPVWDIHESWGDKRTWLESAFGEFATKRLILTHRKDLAKGDYLVDDRLHHGADAFEGVHIHFGQEQWPDWKTITTYLLNNK